MLSNKKFDQVTLKEVVTQIAAKKKCKTKLPKWYHTQNIFYPLGINIEQTSSEITASYKASLINGDSMVDLSGGFGVDTYHFSKQVKKVVHCEINSELSEIVTHNYKVLDCTNIQCIAQDGITYLSEQNKKFDWVYIDPSRRDNHKGKVFLLEDCTPDVAENLSLILSKTDNLLVKVSPLLDLKQTIQKLQFVKEVHIIGVQNEVKELLFIIKKDYTGTIEIKTRNFTKKTVEKFDFNFSENQEATYDLPQLYLYEPNSCILKSGGFNDVSAKYNLSKLHNNTHLYTNNNLISFSGRVFDIQEIVSYNKKNVNKLFNSKKFNITTRNFPITVSEIRKKFKIKDGGTQYLFFTTNINDEKIIIICNKVK